MTANEAKLTTAIAAWKALKDEAREVAKDFRERIEVAESEILQIADEVRFGQKSLIDAMLPPGVESVKITSDGVSTTLARE